MTAFRDGQVTLRTNRRTEGFTEALQEIGYHGIRRGDLVIHGMDAFAGAIGVSDSDGKSSPVVHAYVGTRGEVRFIAYCLRAASRLGFIQSLAKGIRERSTAFDPASFKYLPLPAPSLDEQRAIADFLDRETAKIDALIDKQNQVVELLVERRAAAVRNALTGQASGFHGRRPSGIEMIESLPSHWTTVPTRHLCRITTGTEDSGNADPEGEYPFYVRGQEILRIGNYGFDAEAVLTPGDGQGGTGKVFHYVNGKFQAHQRVYVFKNFKRVSGRYFYYWLSTFLKPVALAGANTVTMESLRRPLLASLPVAVPPLSEQHDVVARLDRQGAQIDALIAKAEEFVALARERRAALITAAVTGQLDVRAARQAALGDDLAARLTDDEASWLDAELDSPR